MKTPKLSRLWQMLPLLGLILVNAAQGQPTFSTNGLVAFYPFNGNADDESGHGNAGTVDSSVALAADRFGNQNAAYSFNRNGSIRLANTSLLDGATAASISGWAYNRLGTGEGGFVVGADDGRSGKDPFVVGFLGSGLREAIFTDTDKSSSHPDRFIGFADLDNGVKVPTNAWFFFTWSFESGTNHTTARFYVNGSLARETNYARAFSVNFDQPMTIRIGALNGFTDSQFRGELDEIRFYDRALSPAETKALFDYEKVPQPQPTRRATGTSQMVNGFVVGVTVTDGGKGYEDPPAVRLVGGGGSGATATANVVNGVVVSITINNPGSGYASAPEVVVASPPFTPELSIEVSRVKVNLKVVLGHRYLLESSTNLTNWVSVGSQFTAEDEALVEEFDVDTTGRYFRLNEVP